MSKKERYRIAGIGEVLWDIYHEERYLGGAPANFAIHVSQLGDEGIVVSRIGNDGMGRELIRALKEKNLSDKYLQVDKHKGTGTVMITINVSGEPSFFCSKDVAFDYLQFTEDIKELAGQVDATVFGSLAQRNEVSRQTIMNFLDHCTGLRIFDVNIRSAFMDFNEVLKASLARSDILKASEQEMELIKRSFHREGDKTISFCRFLMEKYDLKLVALTRGHEGAALILPDEVLSQPALPIKVVDTTGSGDAFTAAFVHGYLRRQPLDKILSFANLLGAYVCTQRGATPEVTYELLEKFEARVRASSQKTAGEWQK